MRDTLKRKKGERMDIYSGRLNGMKLDAFQRGDSITFYRVSVALGQEPKRGPELPIYSQGESESRLQEWKASEIERRAQKMSDESTVDTPAEAGLHDRGDDNPYAYSYE